MPDEAIFPELMVCFVGVLSGVTCRNVNRVEAGGADSNDNGRVVLCELTRGLSNASFFVALGYLFETVALGWRNFL